MRTILIASLLSLPLFGQAPLSISNSMIAGVTQPTGVVITVSGGISSITINAGLACTVAPTVSVFTLNGAGTNAVVTTVCTAGTVVSPLTIGTAGTGYTTGQVFITFHKGLWNMNDDHAHSIPTGGNSPACKTICAFACSGYKSMSLSEKLQNMAYTTQDPGVACRTVGSGSCPVYNATTWAVSTFTVGNPTRLTVTANSDALSALLSTNAATPTPLLLSGSTGTTITTTIDGGGAGNMTPNNTINMPWYAQNIVTVAATSVAFDLYYSKSTNGVSSFALPVVTGTAQSGSPIVQLNGCGSTDQGTNGDVTLPLPGYENTYSDNNALYAKTSWTAQDTGGTHHFTALNVSGSPIPLGTNNMMGEIIYALTHPDLSQGTAQSSVAFSHPYFTTAGWSAQQLAYLGQLRNAYPGQLHVQVFDNQGYYGEGALDLMNSAATGPIWVNSSGDTYNTTVFNSSMKGGGTVVNVDSTTVPNVMDGLNSGRSYAWGNVTSGAIPALRCGVSGLKIVCRTNTSEATQTQLARNYVWVGEGGKIVRVTTSTPTVGDSYTVTGSEGKYIRVVSINGPTNTYGTNFAYIVGNKMLDNWYNSGALNSILWSQPMWISYHGE